MRDRQPTLLEDRSMNLRLTTMTAAVALMFFTPIANYAQDILPAPPGTVAPSAVDTKSDTYTQQKLDQMLAPIALYPDQLVSQILMASTFPLQIAQAARWLDNPSNAALKGEALVTALQPMNWDPSVKSIIAFPAIVTMLNKNLDWTDSLGVAFTHQQCHGANPVPAPPGTESGKPGIERQDRVSRRRAQHRNCADRAERHLCAPLQPGRGLWYVAMGRVSPGLLLARLFRTQPARGRGRLGLGSSVADRAGLLGLVWGELGNGRRHRRRRRRLQPHRLWQRCLGRGQLAASWRRRQSWRVRGGGWGRQASTGRGAPE